MSAAHFASARRVALLALFLAVTPAPAQLTYTWVSDADNPRPWFIDPPGTGGQFNGNWPNNGGGGINAPANTEPLSNITNILVFPGTLNYTAQNNYALGAFQLNGLGLTATTAGDIRITGNPLTFTNSATAAPPTIDKPGNATFTIQNNMTLSGNLSITGTGGGSLNLGDSSGAVPNVISGAGSLTINRAGNTPIYGTNTYSGGTVWLGGSGNPSLAIGNPAAFGTGPVIVSGAANHVTRLVQTSPGILNNGANGNNVTIPNTISLRSDITTSVGSLANSSLTFGGPVSLFNGNRTITQNETGAGKTVSFTGVIQNSIPGLTVPTGQAAEPAAGSGSGGITKAGSGPLTLTGANTYTGNTVVSLGSLILSGSGSIAQSPVITVNSGATLDVSGVTGGANFFNGAFALAAAQALQGAGTVNGNTNVRSGATIAPGSGVGTINISGNTSLAGVLSAQVTGSTADRLAVTGNLDLAGTSVLDLPTSNTYDNTTALQIATYTGTLTGIFNQILNKPANYDVFYGTFAGLPNSVVLAPVAVPEPGALALAGLAAAGLYRWRRRVAGTT